MAVNAATMDFKDLFKKWLEESLRDGTPFNVQGLAFNLSEPANAESVKFAVELIGTPTFTVDDPDWACEEIWAPKQKLLEIPIEFSGDEWEHCLERVRGLVLDFFTSNRNLANECSAIEGIGVGFVDGDLEIVYLNVP